MDSPRQLSELFKQFVESAPILFFSVDCHLNYTYISPFFAQTHHVSQDEAVGKNIIDVIGKIGYEANLHRYQEALAGEVITFNSYFTKLGCEIQYYTGIYTPLQGDGAIKGFTGVIIDKTAEFKLEQVSNTDSLTRICNRRKFESQLIKKLNSDCVTCLLIVDIDYFKKINDELGHDVGDQTLVTLACLLKKLTFSNDAVFRVGGEEFAFLLEGISDKQSLRERADEICSGIASSQILTDRVITISIGAIIIREDDTRETALKRADIALYHAKTIGRNQACIA